ncbi:MAG TPA: DNA polymerase I [Gemmatimonadaceae bacterium]|nr:DNA polymerase I [Gemmatimonadaceae bacterium]
MQPPPAPRLFLVDGYALIYRAFFALISRPLTTSRGENTSAAWGVVNFLQRLREKHTPDYLGWVHDAGLSFRHDRYPAYKATREKLGAELQADFDRGMERIEDILDAYHIDVLTVDGYEADDVIGTLARQAVEAGVNVAIVSGDKDFHQLVRPGVWLLNPGRGGPAGVEEQWVGVENANERLGVPPERVVDYLALVGDSSDNIPGVRGIGDKTAAELIATYGSLEEILAHASEISKKRPREALLASGADARLSRELVTIRDDVPITLDLDALTIREPDHARLKELFVELEFHALAREHAPVRAPEEKRGSPYVIVDSVEALERLVERVRRSGHVAIDTETVVDAGSPQPIDPLRSILVSMSLALAPDEAYYLPFRHREPTPSEELLLIDASGDRAPTDAPEDRGVIAGGDELPRGGVRTARSTRLRSARAASAPRPGNAGRASGELPKIRNLPPLDSPSLTSLRAMLEDATVRKTAQNAKYDLLALRRAGIRLRGLEFDTMVASYVLDPGRRSHGLDVLALEFLDHKMMTYQDLCGKGKLAIPFDQCAVDRARDYSCEDADMALRMRHIFEPQLETYALADLFREIEMPLVEVLAEMEWCGISIDMAWFRSLKERFGAERERVEQQIYAEAGSAFNINSNLQLRQVLFEQLKLPVLKRTSTGASTDATVLQELADQGHRLPELLMEYRELAKLESTYLDALPALVHPETHRLHTSFNQTVASTGRLSSSEPNLQNIPVRRELGRDIRRGFVPRAGWRLIAADYSQIELRVLAHLSADDAFVTAFRAGGDIHRQTAAIIFGVDPEDVTADMRARAKTINFATIYGQGPVALSRQLHIELADAKRFIAEYFARFRGIRAYLDSMVAFAREHGYVQTIFGRRRYIPELRDRNFNVRAFGERTATNSPIQGSAADLIKIAMIRIDRALREEKLQTRMLLQVHDELVFEAPPPELEAVTRLVRQEMEHAAQLSVPLVVELGEGSNWLEAKL